MRILFKLAMKLAFMAISVLVISGGVRYATKSFSGAGGLPGTGLDGGKISAEETGLMSTVFQSALRLVSGSASREELSKDLSRKLYGERADDQTMADLGIELVKTNGEVLKLDDPASKTAGGAPKVAAGMATAQVTSASADSKLAKASEKSADSATGKSKAVGFAVVWERIKVCGVELIVIAVMSIGMFIWHRIRRRAMATDFVPPMVTSPGASDAEPYEMKHAVHAFGSEEFELLIALIYQRQGYRVSMPAGLSGGRGGDFTLLRKAERVLVQCKKLDVDFRIPVERIRELHDAMTAAGATRGLFVASCGFTWDARNFAKTKGITVINARTLDELIIAARANPKEDLLEVAGWIPQLVSKVSFTAPTCPACESGMEEVDTSRNSVWVCGQRPECRGRRPGRKFRKTAPVAPQPSGVLTNV
jgi:hypothetical protein